MQSLTEQAKRLRELADSVEQVAWQPLAPIDGGDVTVREAAAQLRCLLGANETFDIDSSFRFPAGGGAARLVWRVWVSPNFYEAPSLKAAINAVIASRVDKDDDPDHALHAFENATADLRAADIGEPVA